MTGLMTQEEAAARLRVSVKTIYRLRRAGQLRYIPGKPVRVSVEDVERLIADGLVRDPSAPKRAEKPKREEGNAARHMRRHFLMRRILADRKAKRS